MKLTLFAVGALLIGSLLLLGWRTSHSDESGSIQVAFEEWMTQYGRSYSQDEKLFRLGVFKRNTEYINEHNRLHSQGVYSFSMRVNQFADMTDQEYKAAYLTLKRSKPTDVKAITTICKGTIPDTPNPPAALDWALKTATDVQTEGACGSSWAFSATGALEALYAFSRGKILKLSDQQLLDCSRDYGNNGCDGGFMDQAMWYVTDNGITTAEKYPYVATTGKCLYKSTMKLFSTTDCAEVQPFNYTKLISAIVQQPVAVAVDATNFRFYNDGVFDRACGTDLNRGMLLVGYGNLDGKDFWNLKNSQGTSWGRSGYMLLIRPKTDGAGPCGLHMANFIPHNVVV